MRGTISLHITSVAYPELVSRGVSKSRKFKWLVKVGACKDVNPLIKKNHGRGGGGFRQPEKKPGYATVLHMSRSYCIKIGLFELLNSVWLIHCLKSQIAMTKLTGRYVVLIVSHFKKIVINS